MAATVKNERERDINTVLEGYYSLYRNCLLNTLYYGRKADLRYRQALILDITVALSSSASGVSGWYIWTLDQSLKTGWYALAALSAFAAFVKPFLSLDKAAARYNRLYSGYIILYDTMDEIVQRIREQRGVVNSTNERDVQNVRSQYRKLRSDDDPHPRRGLIYRLQNEVENRIPKERLQWSDRR